MGPSAMKRTRYNWAGALAAAALITLVRSQLGSGPASAMVCPAESVGTGAANGNLALWAILGRAWNQEFVAQDTLVSAVTVWRAPPDSGTWDGALQGWHLFITEVETDYDGRIRPKIWPVLFDGGVYFVPPTDGVHPFKVRWDINPPFALPHKGEFSFAIKDHYCDYHVSALVDTTNPYPEGELWKSFATNDCSGLGQATMLMPLTWDLIFEIEFCEASVPVRGTTWGALKAIYR